MKNEIKQIDREKLKILNQIMQKALCSEVLCKLLSFHPIYSPFGFYSFSSCLIFFLLLATPAGFCGGTKCY